MPTRSTSLLARAIIAVAVVAIAVSTASGPGPATAARKKLGAVVAPLKLIPSGGETIAVGGLHRYLGTLEVDSAVNGLVLSNTLPLEQYLLGLNEVPTQWPAEALKAQAVAARTYALYTLAQGPGGAAATYGFDICATVACQVFSGADVLAVSTGDRWAQAVAETSGQAIYYRDAPILARYHSTSGGATLDNSQAFPSEGDFPYLKAVRSEDEAGSPLYRWHVRFKVKRLQRILERAGLWSAASGDLRGANSTNSSAGLHYPDIELHGTQGNERRTAQSIREAVRTHGPALFPKLYPSRGPTSSGRLPEVWPSNRVTVETRSGVVRVEGRGWGHGVGMSQWGAFGLAERGVSYLDILTHYYSGIEIVDAPVPGAIEVGLDWGQRSITAAGSFSIADARGKVLVQNALGTWRFRFDEPGAVAIEPPEGFGLPLRIGIVDAPEAVDIGEAATLRVALSRPAKVKTLTAQAPTGFDDPGSEIKEAGTTRIVWLAPLEPGTYKVRVRASTGGASKKTKAVKIMVEDPTVEVAQPDPDPIETTAEGLGLLPVLAALLLAATALGLVTVTIRR